MWEVTRSLPLPTGIAPHEIKAITADSGLENTPVDATVEQPRTKRFRPSPGRILTTACALLLGAQLVTSTVPAAAQGVTDFAARPTATEGVPVEMIAARLRGIRSDDVKFAPEFGLISADRDSALSFATDFVLTTKDRVAQTLKFMALETDQRPDDLRHLSKGSGYHEIPGSRSSESLYLSEHGHIGDRTAPTRLLLGTPHGAAVAKALLDLIVEADRGLPELQAVHRAAFIAEQVAKSLPDIDELVSNLPESNRAKARSELVGSLEARAATRYLHGHQITGQADVDDVIYGLTRLDTTDAPFYSSAKAATETAKLLTDALPEVTTPSMHRMLADVSLSLLRTAGSHEGIASDGGFAAAAAALEAQLLKPGADPEVHFLTAARLAPVRSTAAMPLLIAGLSHDSEDVRITAVSSIAAMALSLERPEGVVPSVREFANMERAAFETTLEGAQSALQELVNSDPNVWIQIHAAKTLARFAPDQPDAVARLRNLLSPVSEIVQFGENNTGPKNVHVQIAAVRALGEFGANAQSALADLARAADTGKAALSLAQRIEERRSAHEQQSPDQPFALEAEDELNARVVELWSSAGLSEAPDAEAAIRDLARRGVAADKAIERITGSLELAP